MEELQYQLILTQVDGKPEDLPEKIQKEITKVNDLIKQHEAEPSEDIDNAITKLDLEITNQIITHYNKIAEDEKNKSKDGGKTNAPQTPQTNEPPKNTPDPEPKKEPVQQTPPPPNTNDPKPVTEPPVQQPVKQEPVKQEPPTPQMDPKEKAVRDKIGSGKYIATKDLETIVGHKPNDPVQKVGNITLRMKYLDPSKYALVK